MRCLYCGKELALLKRLRGGGEFCSEAHRQQYQEEYNQLALNRLLQAHPAAGMPNPAPVLVADHPSAAPSAAMEIAPAEPHRNGYTSHIAAPPAPVEVPTPRAPEITAPAPLGGFLLDRPPAKEPPAFRCKVDEFEPTFALAPVLPEEAVPIPVDFEELKAAAQPEIAGPLPLPRLQAVPMPLLPVVRNLEAREFNRSVEPWQGVLNAEQQHTLPVSSTPLLIDFVLIGLSQTEPGWMSPCLRFKVQGSELGKFTRVPFRTIGFVPSAEEELPADTLPDPDLSFPYLAGEDQRTESLARREDFAPNEPLPAPMVSLPEPDIAGASFAELPVAVEPEPPAEQLVVPEQTLLPPPPAQPEPSAVLSAMAVEVGAVGPGVARLTPFFKAAVPDLSRIEIPLTASVPLRPVMVLGKTPPKPAVKIEESPGEAQATAGPKKIEATLEARPVRHASQPPKPEQRQVDQPKPERKSNHESRRVALKPPAPPPSEADKLGSKTPAKPVEEFPEKSPVIAKAGPEPTLAPAAIKEENKTPAKESAAVADPPKPVSAPSTDLDLGLPMLYLEGAPPSLWERMPAVAKVAAALVILGIASALGYLLLAGKASAVPKAVLRDTIVAGMPIHDAEWLDNWSPDAARNGRRISLYKTSFPLTDYRLQFEAQIETKALGWVYRVADAMNYQVVKLEVVKPGLEPVVALVHFAVIKGVDQEKKSVPLAKKLRLDSLYKVRFDAIGPRFTTWLGDEKIDEWTDDRLMKGPPGLYSDKGEAAALRGNVNVTPLVVKKR